MRYREPSGARSLIELGITVGPLVLLWVLMWASYYVGFWWLTLLLSVPAAGFLVRLFMIQHDCGHGAFFRHRLANDWIGDDFTFVSVPETSSIASVSAGALAVWFALARRSRR